MPKVAEGLSDIQVKQAKAGAKSAKLFDGGGLYLEVMTSGAKLWRMKYRFAGKENRLSFGAYPAVSLKEARKRRDSAKQMLADGIDPAQIRKAEKQERENAAANSFEVVAKDWHREVLKSGKWSKPHAERIWVALEKDVFPWLGKQAISSLTPMDCKKTIKRIAERGAVESAHRIAQNVSQVFRYAVSHELAARNPMADLMLGLPAVQKKHFATITDPKRVGQLMRDIDSYHGSFVTGLVAGTLAADRRVCPRTWSGDHRRSHQTDRGQP